MDFFDDSILIASSAVQLLAYLALIVLCLARARRPWAVVGLLAGLAALVSTGWFFAAYLALRFTDDGMGATQLFYAPVAQLVMQTLAALSAVLLVVAVLMGRRTAVEDASGPTGTTFRQLPSGVRWE